MLLVPHFHNTTYSLYYPFYVHRPIQQRKILADSIPVIHYFFDFLRLHIDGLSVFQINIYSHMHPAAMTEDRNNLLHALGILTMQPKCYFLTRPENSFPSYAYHPLPILVFCLTMLCPPTPLLLNYHPITNFYHRLCAHPWIIGLAAVVARTANAIAPVQLQTWQELLIVHLATVTACMISQPTIN